MTTSSITLPDMTGRNVIVTGANSGIGSAAAGALAGAGANVVLAVRNTDKGQAAAAAMPGHTEVRQLDLASLASVRDFAAAWDGDIDLLINNAGVMAPPLSRTAEGFELQLGTNHLGHFALTARLAPAIRAGDHPRVVTLSSAGHSRSNVDLDDYNFEVTPYNAWIAYGRSKTANALFARELATRAGASGALSFSVHPGGIVTELGRHLDDQLRNDMMSFARERAITFGDYGEDGEPRRMPFKSVPAGAATQVWAATTSSLAQHNGAYLADCGVGVRGANPTSNGYMDYLLDDEHARRLWTLSEGLTGVSFL
jgi:NAD(P)-dependent dehydrogenase (short-subunit alcohol dehydrogenase family)